MGSYLSGQGKVYQAKRDANGNSLDFIFIGNVPSFELAISIDTLEHRESTSGNRLVDLRLVTGNKVDLTMNAQEFTADNLALLLHGNIYTSSPGSVTAELIGGGATTVAAGQSFALKNPNGSALVITDSAGSPATLALGTDYTASLPYGLVSFLNVGTFVQPFKAAYTKIAAQKSVDMLTVAPPERWVRILGINTAQKNTDGSYKRFVLDLFNVQFDPTAGFAVINDAVADQQLKGSVLVDTTRSATGQGGQIGQLIFID